MMHMRHDKKVKDGKINFVLLRRIGEAFVTADVPMTEVRKVLAQQ